MIGYLRRGRAAAATPGVLAVYVAAVLLGAAAAAGWFPAYVAAILLTLVVVLVIQTSMRHEVVKVHTLVNSQRDEFVARIDQLTQRLVETGQRVPSDPAAGGQR